MGSGKLATGGVSAAADVIPDRIGACESARKFVNWRTISPFIGTIEGLPGARLCTRDNRARNHGALMTKFNAMRKEPSLTH